MKVHPVFHVSLLKSYSGTPTAPPAPIVIDGEQEYIVDSIVTHRYSRRGLHYLVRWKGYDSSSDEWLPEAELKHAKEVLAQYKRKYMTSHKG